MKNRAIIFTEPNVAELVDKGELSALKEDEVKVKTLFSTVSCGTERANITADPNVSPNGSGKVLFPRQLGYSSSGIVEEVGERVTSVKAGDRVVMHWSTHSEYNVLKEDRVIKIEDDSISMQEAAVAFITTFPMAAIRKTRLEIGESVLVVGLGLLGQLAVKLARISGAVPIVAVDPVKERREEALKNGADYAFDPFEEGFELDEAYVNEILKSQKETLGITDFLKASKEYTKETFYNLNVEDIFEDAITGRIGNSNIFNSMLNVLGRETKTAVSNIGIIMIVIIQYNKFQKSLI